MKFRELRPDEIDVRVSMIKDTGAQLLLYKDARCDMRILDETVGPENWQRKHYDCKGNLFCSVGIKIDGEWIWKDDCGTESNAEKEKGESSDSFKRACFNWGIGRELYTAPFIWVKNKDGEYDFKRDRFYVSDIKYKDGKITYLLLGGTVAYLPKEYVFQWKEKPIYSRIPPETPACPICGKDVVDVKCKDGSTMSAQQVFSNYGMCADCKRGQNEPAN